MKRAWLLLLLTSACAGKRTEVVLLIDNNGLAIPSQIDTLHVKLSVNDPTLTGADATLYDSGPVPLCTTETGTCHTLPVDFTLLPGPKRADDPVVVEVQALLGANVVIDDTAVFTFLHGQSQRLDVTLSPACLGTDCSTSQEVCGSNGQCVAAVPTKLTGTPDLSAAQHSDGGVDQGVPDLGRDLGKVDLEKAPDLSAKRECGDEGVVDTSSDPNNCGACDNVCPDPSTAPNTAGACMASVCGLGCATGWADCDGVTSNGCEHDVSDDVMNCGACSHVCGNANTVNTKAVCTNDKCVFNCSAGSAHCSMDDTTGCETSIDSDPKNCGACGFDCGSATCSGGFCVLTPAHAEYSGSADSVPILAQDATTLYWINEGGTNPAIVRKVNKDGTGLGNVFPMTQTMSTNASLAVDKNYIYFWGDTYDGTIWRGVKNGSADAQAWATNFAGASADGIVLDVDYTGSANYVYYTQALNGPGLYRVTASSPTTVTEIYGASEAHGYTRQGTTLFFGTASDTVQMFDTTAATPVFKQLFSCSASIRGMASDATNVYVLCDDSNLHQVNIATGDSTVLATGGAGDGKVETDGKFVYVINGDLYKIAPNSKSQPYANYKYIASNTLPKTGTFSSLVIDDDYLYLLTYTDVYKVPK